VTKTSGGLLPYSTASGQIEVFLVHPGGPYFAHQNEGIWSVAKGILEEGEGREAGARREFEEETGVLPPPGPYLDLGEVTLRSGKIVFVLAFEADRSLAFVDSNEFEIEWPKRSGNLQHFPEVDRAEWFTIPEAKRHLLSGQHPFLDRLAVALVAHGDEIGA
jgi:predicted NUDIX family NTP pyrophosphohydrolase